MFSEVVVFKLSDITFEQEMDMNISVLGIDTAKNVFQLYGVNRYGKAILKKRLSRVSSPV